MKPSIDVIIFSYNHEKFIEQAIESVAAQDYDGPIRVRLHDDCSQDDTVLIAKSVLDRIGLPHEVQVAQENQYRLGSMFRWNFIRECTADFIAFLDGDDYWVDSSKLRLQARTLDEFPSAVISHHRFEGEKEDGTRVSFSPPNRFRQELVPGSLLADHNFVGTSSVLMRRQALPNSISETFNDCRGVDDYPIWAIVSSGADLVFIDRVMSVYRLHPGQNFANLDRQVQTRQLFRALLFIYSAVRADERELWLPQIESVAAELQQATFSDKKRLNRCVKMARCFLAKWLERAH